LALPGAQILPAELKLCHLGAANLDCSTARRIASRLNDQTIVERLRAWIENLKTHSSAPNPKQLRINPAQPHPERPVRLLHCRKKLKDPIATVTRPPSAQANGEPAAMAPATTQAPKAAIPTEIRYAAPVSIFGPQDIGRKPFIGVVEYQKTQSALEPKKRFRFVVLYAAIRRAGLQLAYREHPCADVLHVQMASHQSDTLD
jgi:hypothetical protein